MSNAILRFLIGVVLFSLLAVIVVLIIGLVQGWKTSVQFSDGLFWAGASLFVVGFISYQGYSRRSEDGPPAQVEQADRSTLWMADISRGKKLMAFFGISGLLLFGLALLVARLV